MSTPLVSIVMTYFERAAQLRNTLYSFRKHSYAKDVEVIIVDDGSVKELASIPSFSFDFRLSIIRIPPKQKWYRNPCIPFNVGFKAATGEIILIQNAECIHYSNIALHAARNVNDRNYLSYACYSLDRATTSTLWNTMEKGDFFTGFSFSSEKTIGDGANGWYNHSEIRPVGYHFCAAITRKNLERLGGFDERYARGIGWDDNEILYRIRQMPLEVIIVDESIVLHQFHYAKEHSEARSNDYGDRNRLLFEKFTTNGSKLSGYGKFVLAFFFFKLKRLRKPLSIIKKRLLRYLPGCYAKRS